MDARASGGQHDRDECQRRKRQRNHQTAPMLGLTVPPSLLALADEVIE